MNPAPPVGLIFLVAVLVILGSFFLFAFLMYRTARMSAGRTTRQFHSDKDVWGILELWAERHDYELAGRDENSRRYLKNGAWFHFLDPQVVLSRTGSGYQLDASVFTRNDAATSVVMMMAPREIALDKPTDWWFARGWWASRSNQIPIARLDVNELIDMLDAGIEPIFFS